MGEALIPKVFEHFGDSHSGLGRPTQWATGGFTPDTEGKTPLPEGSDACTAVGHEVLLNTGWELFQTEAIPLVDEGNDA